MAFKTGFILAIATALAAPFPVMAQASLVVRWDRVLADAAFDAEEHHRYCREDRGVRATVIPLNPAAGAGSGPRRSTGGRWSSGSGRSRGAAATAGCTAKGGRPSPRSAGTSGVSAARWAGGRTRPASGSATSGC